MGEQKRRRACWAAEDLASPNKMQAGYNLDLTRLSLLHGYRGCKVRQPADPLSPEGAQSEDKTHNETYKDIYYKFGTFKTPDKLFAHQVERRALHLWRGEQVDGSTWSGPQSPARVPLEDMYIWPGADWPGAKYFMDRAVMAGYRYLVSFRSTPRHMRVNGYVRP